MYKRQPSHSSLHPPLAVFSPFSFGYCCNTQDINIIFYLGHTAEGSTCLSTQLGAVAAPSPEHHCLSDCCHWLQITSSLSRTCSLAHVKKGGLSHTFNGINSRNDRKRIDYILTRQAHRPRVYDVKVHPQPPSPAKTDSDHNIVHAMVRLSGRIAPNRRIPTKKKSSLSTSRSFDLTEIADSE